MITVVVLDSEAVSILAARKRNDTTERMRQFVTDHVRAGGAVVVPANVIAQTRRGSRAPGIDRVLNSFPIRDVDRAISSLAGEILESHGRGSRDLVDATVVATAALARAEAVIVLTSERSARTSENDVAAFAEPWSNKVLVKAISSF